MDGMEWNGGSDLSESNTERLAHPNVSFWHNLLFNKVTLLQSETDVDKEAWMSVLLNSKDGALTQAFAETGTTSAKGANGGYAELQRALVAYIRNLPSNDKCCDCGSNNGEEIRNAVFLSKYRIVPQYVIDVG